MRTQVYTSNIMEIEPDSNIDPRLLPPHLRENSNTKRIEAYKIVLKMAMLNFLTPEQRYFLRAFYWQRKSKTEIGKELGIGDSAVCKQIKRAESKLREHMEFIEKVYDVIVRVGDMETED